ncbi:MAG: sodium:calcium antiporter [Sphingomicrobium sp.]|nr:sodium:calcium antiporter [Sphingomonadales bacterium]
MLVAIFAVSSAVVWLAGTRLSKATDILCKRFRIGEALGGAILLAVATNLPEIAITSSGALSGNLGVAVGNILGGVAIQTVVLVLLDRFGIDTTISLTHRAGSLKLVIEGLLVVCVLVLTIMATQLPPSVIVFRLTPGGVMITLFWLLGLWLIGRAKSGLPWQDAAHASRSRDPGEKEPSNDRGNNTEVTSDGSTAKAAVIFLLAAVATLVCGVLLEESGSAIANHLGMSGVVFGATALAAATALPEVSTGFALTKLHDYELAVSDILGGNAFLPVLFLLAELISGRAVLPHAQGTDIYLAALGVLLTSIYLGGLIFRSKRTVAGVGVDSLLVLILYGLGMAGLFAIAAAPTIGGTQ